MQTQYSFAVRKIQVTGIRVTTREVRKLQRMGRCWNHRPALLWREKQWQLRPLNMKRLLTGVQIATPTGATALPAIPSRVSTASIPTASTNWRQTNDRRGVTGPRATWQECRWHPTAGRCRPLPTPDRPCDRTLTEPCCLSRVYIPAHRRPVDNNLRCSPSWQPTVGPSAMVLHGVCTDYDPDTNVGRGGITRTSVARDNCPAGDTNPSTVSHRGETVGLQSTA